MSRAFRHRPDVRLRLACGHRSGALALPLSYMHHFHPMPENVRVRARAELFVEMNRMPKDAIDAQGGAAHPAAVAEGLCARRRCIGDGAVIDRQFGTTDVFIYFPLSGIDARYKSRFGLVNSRGLRHPSTGSCSTRSAWEWRDDLRPELADGWGGRLPLVASASSHIKQQHFARHVRAARPGPDP